MFEMNLRIRKEQCAEYKHEAQKCAKRTVVAIALTASQQISIFKISIVGIFKFFLEASEALILVA